VSRIALSQILRRQTGATALIAALGDALGAPIAVEDPQGRVVHGAPGSAPGQPAEAMRRVPVALDEISLGWVSGSPASAPAVAAVLAHLAAREVEHKSLGAEVLHLYREINLIYSFSEKLAALLDVERVALLTLHEAQRLIGATDSAVMLLDEASGALPVIAGRGESLDGRTHRRGEGIPGAVAASGAGEIVNDVEADPRRTEGSSIRTLICAPLKTGERVIGLIALGNTESATYSAADLKLLNTLALQAATAIENARLFERTVQAARERERLQALHQAAELARTRLESEMTLASRIQADLFPAHLPAIAGYDLSARNRAARLCGGDYYDVLRSTSVAGDAHVLCCVADVAGKGLPAALVMSNMQATLRALLGRIHPLAALAGHASDLLYAATPPEKYVTAILAELAPESGAVTIVSAGHLDNAIIRADGTIVPLVSTGMPLGLMPDGLPYTETTQHLGPDDALVLYSDGVTDAQNPAGEEFGEARLHDLLRAHRTASPAAMADAILRAVDVFADGAPQFDDMTLLILRRGTSAAAVAAAPR